MSEPRQLETPASGEHSALHEFDQQLRQLWRQGQQPDVHRFVAEAGDLSLDQLVAVLAVDQRERWQSSECVPAEAYLQPYPRLQADVEKALELVYGEFLLREELGDMPAPDEYLWRFPQYAERLRQQLDLHGALASNRLDPNKDSAHGPDTVHSPARAGGAVDQAGQLQAAPTIQRDQAIPPASASRREGAAGRAHLPQVFGRYRIQRQLGQGSMGAVYLAHDQQLDRAVALKIPRLDGDTDSRSVERFYREARIAATFHHPNLCPVFDVGQIGGVHYLTMPYLPGEPLSAWLKRERRLPPTVAARLAARTARALEVAHHAGVLHRDLKPANIMILPNQEPVVMDFGLARRARMVDPQLTFSGFVLGTPAYIPPEQIGGSPEALGPACDIYSLGAVLYEMLTGRVPFVGSVHDVLRQAATTPPPPLATLVPGIDPQLEALCLAALAKEPTRRFASAAAFAEALEQWEKGDAFHFRNRRRVLWVALLGVVLALVIGLVALLRPSFSPADPLPANSRWEGAFKFRPPNERYTGEVRLDITGRHGESFVGIYATEAGRWQWEVTGTLRDGKIDWEFTRIIHEAEPRQVVGHAKVSGRLRGPSMEVLYHDQDSVADMTLWRAN